MLCVIPYGMGNNMPRGKMNEVQFDHALLLELAAMKMPFGKYAGRRLIDLPEPYVVWFARKGFPRGKLGEMLAIVHEIKINGLEYLFAPLVSGKKSDE
jgi:uncharacterized protein (DUF3820 family)